MTTGLLQQVVQLPAVSGLPEDTCENVFHFWVDGASSDPGTISTVVAAYLIDFYNEIGTGAAADIASCIGEQIDRSSLVCKVVGYFKDDASFPDPFGSPVATTSWTLDAATAGLNLPSECAVVASIHGDLTDVPESQNNPSPPPAKIRPAARRRGRLYLGPLTTSSGTEDATTHELLPSSGFRNSIVGACVDLLAAMTPGALDWVVWSRASGEVFPIVGGYVDYAYDTQRRRGEAPVARQMWP